eukprot:gene10362-1482_t
MPSIPGCAVRYAYNYAQPPPPTQLADLVAHYFGADSEECPRCAARAEGGHDLARSLWRRRRLVVAPRVAVVELDPPGERKALFRL